MLVQNFFDLNGNNMFFGGAERYILELERLISKLGYDLVVYQCANSNWVRYYGDVKTIGINTGGNNNQLLNRYFHSWLPNQMLTIYFQMILSTPKFNSPSICVSHGVDWDSPWLQLNEQAYKKFIKNVVLSIQNTDILISVDTNTINWIRAKNYKLSSKCVYIPNFVDCDEFKPLNKQNQSDKLVILFPRRLSEARGLHLMLNVIPLLLEIYPNLEFHFCGKANQTEEMEVCELINQYPNNIKRFFYPPHEMNKVYIPADIVVIPTLYSEGTSLSCIEAMASEKAVIATNVGGLTNLIIPEFNGLLIEPDVSSLKCAIETLINDAPLRKKIALNGLQTAKTLDILTWQKRWLAILNNYISKKSDLSVRYSKKVILFLEMQWSLKKNNKLNYFQKAAIFLAQNGYEIFWIHSDMKKESRVPNLHLLTYGIDDIYFQNPIIFTDKPFKPQKYSFTPRAIIDLTVEREFQDYLEMIKSL